MIADANEDLLSLHRYFIWANRMRTHFEEVITTSGIPEGQLTIEARTYLSYWYSGLYVVIEGWQDLGLKDAEIDELLNSAFVDLLKRFQNGTFHFQRKYNDDRFTQFLAEGQAAVDWVRNLNRQFGRYLLAAMRKDQSK